MAPRPAPDLARRREEITRVAHDIAEAEGWAAVTMRRVSADLGVTQPVLYSAFAGRQALIDAVALEGFATLERALRGAEPTPLARIETYLGFAMGHPHIYEAMFSMPSELRFAKAAHEPLLAAFEAIRESFAPHHARSGDHEEVDIEESNLRAEVAWATLHGLATLQEGGRLPAIHAKARLEQAYRMLTGGAGGG